MFQPNQSNNQNLNSIINYFKQKSSVLKYSNLPEHTKKPFVLILIAIFLFSTIIVSASLFFNTQQAHASWYDYSWQYKKKITIDHTKVSATLTDFPVLINLTTDAELASSAQDDGDDILFTLTDDTTKLSHEIETFNGTTGELVAWVKIASLSHTADTELYLYYGNATCVSQQNGTDVWSNGYVGVWHMGEGAGTTVADSVNGNTGNFAGNLAWQSDSIYSPGGGNDEISIANSASLNFSSGITLISSFKQTAVASAAQRTIVQKSYTVDSAPYYQYLWYTYSTGFGLQLSIGGTRKLIDYAVGEMEIGVYHTYATTYDSATGFAKYRDGNQIGTDNTVTGNISNYATNVGLFDEISGHGNTNFQGNMKWLFILNRAVSANEISTMYANQNDPSTFYSLDGAQERETTPPTNPTTFKTYSSSAKTTEFTNGGWGNATAPYFEWSGADDDESGVDGYYLYLGTNSSADPAVTSGIIEADSSPHYTTSSNFTLSQPMTEDTTYYFRIKTKDNALNVSSTGDMFTYSFETSAPDPPEYINVSPAGCSTANDFTFTWPVATDNGDSGIAGYQYKKGAAGSIQTVPSGLTLSETAYQDSDNVLYLRSIDNAGNVSIWQTAVYCTIEAASVIDGPDVTASPTSLIISWRSNKETTGYVEVYEGNTYLSQFGINTYSTDHTVSIIGLKSEQSYRYRVSWRDTEGNLDTSGWFTTSTTKAPQVEDLKISTLSATSMLVNFSTNYSSVATLEYGENSYKNSYQFTDFATSFSHQLENLSVGTTYKLRILARSEDGTEFAAGESFSTPPYPTVSNFKITPINEESQPQIKVTWNTNVNTTSSVFYRTGTDNFKESSKSDKTKDHEIIIGGLADDSVYEVYVSGIDEYGNTAKSSIFKHTTPLDTRPPVLSNLTIESKTVGSGDESSVQLIVSWETDEPATSKVEYAKGVTSKKYTNSTQEDSALVTTHTVVASDLEPTSPYHLRAVSADKARNQGVSDDNTVITSKAKLSAWQIIINTLKDAFGFMFGK